MTAPATITGLDHVGVVGRDMTSLREAYRRLGFAPTPARALLARDPLTGERRTLDQSSCHLMFESGYCELSAITRSAPDHHLAPYSKRHAGLQILALTGEDLTAQRDRLVALGVPVSAIQYATRDIGYGTRHGAAQFEWFMLDPAVSPAALLCFVHNLSPQLVYQAEVQRHPNSASALVGASFVVEDLAGTASFMAWITGAQPIVRDDAVELPLAAGTLNLLTASAFAQRFPASDAPALPLLASMTIAVRQWDPLRRCCADAGIALRGEAQRRWIAAADAAGAIIEFVQDRRFGQGASL